MFRILEKEYFSERVVKLVVEAPEVARARKAGHFVIVRTGEGGERSHLHNRIQVAHSDERHIWISTASLFHLV